MNAENPGEKGRGRWSFTTGHRVFQDALVREMEDYLLLRAIILEELESEPSQSRLDERRAVLTLLIAGYIEAIANVYLSFRCDAEKFKEVERLPLLRKWESVPAAFVPGYRLDPASAIYRELGALIECRNGIVHMRPKFEVDGVACHPGNTQALETISHELVMKWITLPERLIEHVKNFDKTDDAQQLHFRSDVWELKIDWEERVKWIRRRREAGKRFWYEV